MNIAEYAAHRGCALETIRNAILAGRILARPDGTIDPDSADRQWQENAKAPASGARGQALRETGATEAYAGMMYADARALREVYEAQRKRLELQVRAGELVSREGAEKAAFTRFRMLRDACMNLPSRLSARLAAEKDESSVYTILESEVRRVFEDFADGRI